MSTNSIPAPEKLFYSYNPDYVYLDNAASTPVFACAKHAVDSFLGTYGSIHRGAGPYSVISTDRYEAARQTVEKFIGARPGRDVVIFTGNTTEAINKMTQIFPFEVGDVLLTSDIEHSSDLLPWRKHVAVETFATDQYYRITPEAVEDCLSRNPHIRMVAVAGASNLTGLITPVREIYDVCRRHEVYLFIDASQLASHAPISLDDCDFVAFSGHKMYAPFGGGVLAGRKDILNLPGTAATGGGNVCYVHHRYGPVNKEAPWLHEPGTPNGAGAVALAAAAQKLMDIGWDAISEHNREVSRWIVDAFDRVPGADLIFPNRELVAQGVEHTPIAVFNVLGHNNMDVAEQLGERSIAVRGGTFCLYSLVERVMKITQTEQDATYMANCSSGRCRLGEHYALIRASGGLMTRQDDFDRLADAINDITGRG